MRSFLLGAPVEGAFNIPFKVERGESMETIAVDSDKITYSDIVAWIQARCGEVDSPTLWVRADKPETVRDLVMFYSHNNSGTATNYGALVYGTLSGVYVIAPLASTRFAPLAAGTKFNVYRMS